MNEEIVSASLDNLEDILQIENNCFKCPWKKADLIYELSENPINKFFLYKKENKIIGFIDFMITFNSSTISQIAVEKEYRKKGYATKLLNTMEEYLPHDGDDEVETITLEVRKSNLAAIEFYKKNGFEYIVDKPHYYSDGEDAIYMVKRLIKWH